MTDSARPRSRDALIAAALAVFSEEGYEAATVTEIAERAGVTTGALYANFTGKLDLLLNALGIMPVSAFSRELSEAAAQPWSQVARVLSENMAAAPDRGSLLLLDAIVAARRDAKVAETLRAGFLAYEGAMTRATQAGTALGVLDPAVAPADLARVFTLLTLGRLVVAAIDGSAPSPSAYARLAELLLQASGAVGNGDPMGLLRTRAEALARAKQELADGVVAAVEAGGSLRQVGAAAGLSHERVRQILRRRSVN